MSVRPVSIEEICHADHERLARMVREQPTVTREAWDKQVKLFDGLKLSITAVNGSRCSSPSITLR